MSANHHFIAQRDETGTWHVIDTYRSGSPVAGPFKDAGAAIDDARQRNSARAHPIGIEESPCS